jgi:bile acid-coenzyme A ligase
VLLTQSLCATENTVVHLADLASYPAEPYVRVLRRLAQEDPDASAVTCGEVTLTRRELDRRSNRLARAYTDAGVGFGDMVTIGLPNSVELLVALVAIWKLGGVPQPVSPRLPVLERQAIVDLADSRLILGAQASDHPGRTCLPVGFEPRADLSDALLPEVVSPAFKAPTSGGSTGRPKLIVSGSGAEGSPEALAAIFQFERDDRQIVAGPLYHNAPLTHAIAGLLLGHHVVVMERFDAAELLRLVEVHRATWLLLVPTMLLRVHRLLEHGASADLSSLRVLWHMASACPEWLKQAWIDRIGAEKVWELYGGTEMQALTIITGSEWLQHRGSVGRPALGEMVVLDADGAELPPLQVGEIFLRRPEGTPETYRYIGADATSRDGWESLGDLGWKDEDGYLYLSDRRVDLIVSGGVNIYPAEVEAALEAHPHVLSSVVVGLPDPELGATVHALVQAAPGTTVQDLLGFVGTRIVRYKVPRSVEFVDTPLRDDAGKARRSALRDAAIERMSTGV